MVKRRPQSEKHKNKTVVDPKLRPWTNKEPLTLSEDEVDFSFQEIFSTDGVKKKQVVENQIQQSIFIKSMQNLEGGQMIL